MTAQQAYLELQGLNPYARAFERTDEDEEGAANDKPADQPAPAPATATKPVMKIAEIPERKVAEPPTTTAAPESAPEPEEEVDEIDYASGMVKPKKKATDGEISKRACSPALHSPARGRLKYLQPTITFA